MHFWNTENEDLPQLSSTLLKTEPLGAEFKTLVCYITGAMLLLGI